MKKLKLKEKTFNIPDSWYDIKLYTYNKLAELEKNEEQFDNIDYSVRFLATVLDVDDEEISNLEPDDFALLFKEIHSFTITDIPRIESNVIDIDGKTFVFDNNFNNISIGMFADLNNITKNDVDFFPVAEKVASIFIRQVKNEKKFILKGKKLLGLKIKPSDYRIKDYDGKESLVNQILFLEKLPMPYYVEVAGFFLSLPEQLKKTSKFYTQNQETKKSQKEEKIQENQ